MSAIPEKINLDDRDQALLDYILEYVLNDEGFCEDCPDLQYEPDTGSWECPCGYDQESSECYRASDWETVKEEAETFICNIHGCW